MRALQQESEQLAARFAAAEAKCATVTRERDDLAVQLASAAQDKTKDAHSAERDAAMQALAIFRQETDSLRQALAQREASVAQLQREVAERDAERRAQAEQARKADTSEEELRSQLVEKTRQLGAAEGKRKEEFDGAQAQIVGLTLRVSQCEAVLAKKDEDYAAQHRKQSDGIDMLEKRLSEVQTELQNKQETLEAREGTVATLERKVKELEEELSHKSNESSRGSEALRELEKQLQMQSEMLAVATQQQQDPAVERGRVVQFLSLRFP